MDWCRASVWLCLLMVGAGCPHDHMRDGFLDRAARKDMRENLEDEEECPPEKSWQQDCKNRLPDGSCRWECL